MKKTISNIFMTAALLMAGMVVVSCEKANTPVSGTFTMTIDASKANLGGAKALALVDGTTLNATWDANDEVAVYVGENRLGTLKPIQTGNYNTTLSGKISGTISGEDELILKFCENPNYASQDGTLDYIADNCDYAEATVSVKAVEGDAIIIDGSAVFENQQAIVKFNLKNNAATPEPINAKPLVVSVGSNSYTVNPESPNSELFVAIPGFNGNVTLTATVGSDTYTKTKEGVTLENGKYYEINVNMTKVE